MFYKYIDRDQTLENGLEVKGGYVYIEDKSFSTNKYKGCFLIKEFGNSSDTGVPYCDYGFVLDNNNEWVFVEDIEVDYSKIGYDLVYYSICAIMNYMKENYSEHYNKTLNTFRQTFNILIKTFGCQQLLYGAVLSNVLQATADSYTHQYINDLTIDREISDPAELTSFIVRLSFYDDNSTLDKLSRQILEG